MKPGFRHLNYYEILDISRGGDVKEIQEGYFLVREAFGKNALASFSLYSPEERDDILKLVEEAYHVLFDAMGRDEYDKKLSENRIRMERLERAQPALPFDETAGNGMTPLRIGPAEPTVEIAAPAPEAAPDETAAPEDAPAPASVAPPGPAEDTPAAAGEEEEQPSPPPAPAVKEIDAGEVQTIKLDDTAPLVEEDDGETEPDDEEDLGEETDPILLDQPLDEEEPETPPASVNAAVPETAPELPPAPDLDSGSDISSSTLGFLNGGLADPQPSPARKVLHVLDYLEAGVSGDVFREARQQIGISLDQAYLATRIRRHILQAIEDEDYERLPAPVFLRGMLQIYARYLGLDNAEAAAKSYMERQAGKNSPLERR